MRRALHFLCLTVAAGLIAAAAPTSAGQTVQSSARRLAPEKFIPTYAIKYGSFNYGVRPTEETANFDLLIVSRAAAAAQAWGREGKNSWHALKALNPDMVILMYVQGPTRYNTAKWSNLGAGWAWIEQNHGKGARDRWVELGAIYGDYLMNPYYPNERAMIPGNPRWREWWRQAVYDDLWGGRKHIDVDGLDGLFCDTTSYHLREKWVRVGHPEQVDYPSTYWADGKYQDEKFHRDLDAFWNETVPWLAARGIIIAPNVCYMGSHPEYWHRLDGLPHPPWAAMEEGGFICPYGGQSFNTWNWRKVVDTIRSLKNVIVLVNNHGKLDTDAKGLARMDVAGPSKSHRDTMTGWDALWFAMTSFLMAFDDVRGNAIMNFTVWGYGEYHWFDEFDPRYIHLGRARGDYFQAGRVFMREFDDGWAVVNPSQKSARGIKVPAGRARVINHSNFKHPETAPLVTRFDLPAHRGVILLKEGRKLGNSDNT